MSIAGMIIKDSRSGTGGPVLIHIKKAGFRHIPGRGAGPAFPFGKPGTYRYPGKVFNSSSTPSSASSAAVTHLSPLLKNVEDCRTFSENDCWVLSKILP